MEAQLLSFRLALRLTPPSPREGSQKEGKRVHGRRCRVGQDCAARRRDLGQSPGEGGLGQAGGFDWRWVGRELERGGSG